MAKEVVSGVAGKASRGRGSNHPGQSAPLPASTAAQGPMLQERGEMEIVPRRPGSGWPSAELPICCPDSPATAKSNDSSSSQGSSHSPLLFTMGVVPLG